MAVVKSPLMSVYAKGSIKKTITYTYQRGVNVVKSFCASPLKRTEKQVEQRAKFSAAKDLWNTLTIEQKKSYDKYISGDILTGYNWFIKNKVLDFNLDKLVAIIMLMSKFYGIMPFGFKPFYQNEYFKGELFRDGN